MFDFTNRFGSGVAVSNSQLDFFNRLLKQKNIAVGQIIELEGNEYTIPNPVGMSKSDLSYYIGILQLIRAQRPITIGQIDTITENCTKLGIATPKMDTWTTDKASQFIATLFEMAKELRKKEPASEMQMQRIVALFDMEIINAIPENLTREDASELIEDTESAYREWLSTHASVSQVNMIQSLQRRVGDKVLDATELRKMSRETASQLIEELNQELRNRNNILYARTQYHETVDSSRNRDKEDNATSWEKYDTERKMKVYAGLCKFANIPVQSELNEDKLDAQILGAMKLAMFYESKEAIRAMIEACGSVEKPASAEEKKTERKTRTRK